MALLPSGDFIDLISRDAENVPGPLAFGNKYITGGAGEGEQKLREEENFQQRQEVKSDNVLPAYCEPPNPCPVGYTAADGCIEEFENSGSSGLHRRPATECCFVDVLHSGMAADVLLASSGVLSSPFCMPQKPVPACRHNTGRPDGQISSIGPTDYLICGHLPGDPEITTGRSESNA
ncbi:hypothetical protein Y032_0005g2469 [Ancylostoma ceylanicum]|nr:hypothetical protein Y032_0005g2469 [Ancylostoma ceylanicum]